jgi:hypothetical protein
MWLLIKNSPRKRPEGASCCRHTVLHKLPFFVLSPSVRAKMVVLIIGQSHLLSEIWEALKQRAFSQARTAIGAP